ncbi:MAG: hypothetical protein LBS27_00720 [Bifidobacteriaceae bacterium]|jgi:hypothetical protein|nr:hypothetical protein [Bifidobacteriaceae bacterium]
MKLSPVQARGLLEYHQVGPALGLVAAICVDRGGEGPGGPDGIGRPGGGIEARLGTAMLTIEPLEGLPEAEANRLAAAAGLPDSDRGRAATLLTELWRLVSAEDLLQVRYGPAVATVVLDDAAAFRHPDWARFGFAVDPAGGPYLAKTAAIAAVDAGAGIPPEDWAKIPAMDALVFRAYAQAHR